MTKITTLEKIALSVMAKSGFTFTRDSNFSSKRQAATVLNRLVRAGLARQEAHDDSMYVITKDGRDILAAARS